MEGVDVRLAFLNFIYKSADGDPRETPPVMFHKL
jgi:hypothetical protein